MRRGRLWRRLWTAAIATAACAAVGTGQDSGGSSGSGSSETSGGTVEDVNANSGTRPNPTDNPVLLGWIGDDGGSQVRLWRSNSNSATTAPVAGTLPSILDPQGFTSREKQDAPVLFVASDGTATYLWSYDFENPASPLTWGIAAEPVRAAATATLQVGDAVYFAGIDSAGTEIWKADRTAGTAALLHNVAPGTASALPRHLTYASGCVFFSAEVNGDRELWAFDASSADPPLPLAINPNGSSNPDQLTAAEGHGVYLIANGGTGSKVHFTDGAPPTAVTPAAGHSYRNPTELAFVKKTASGQVFFAAPAPAASELWVVAAGATTATQLTSQGMMPEHLTALGERLFFVGSRQGRRTLFYSEGTAATTGPVSAFGGPVDITALATARDKLFAFTARELWVFDGNLTKLTTFDGTLEAPVGTSDGRMFFIHYRGDRKDLWVSNGATDETVPVMKSQSSYPTGYTSLGNLMVFAADGATAGTTYGREPWVTDGTKPNTVLLKDIMEADSMGVDKRISSDPELFTPVGSYVYFVATHRGTGRELWRTQGTADTTTLVKDVHSGADPSGVRDLTVLNSTLFFAAARRTTDQLWSTVGEAEPQRLRHDGDYLDDPRDLTVITDNGDRFLFFTAIVTNTASGERERRVFAANEAKVIVIRGCLGTVPAAFTLSPAQHKVIYNGAHDLRGVEPHQVSIAEVRAALASTDAEDS